MPEPFEIIDPVERFVAAREGLCPGTEPTRQGWQIRTNPALWLVGVAIFAISTLILVYTLSPRIGGEFASGGNNQSASDKAPQHHVSSPQPGSDPPALVAGPPQAQSVHAIDPEASAAQSSGSQVQTSQKSTVTSGRQAAAVESAPSAQLKDKSSAPVEVTQAPSHPGLGDQLLKLTSAATIHNGPSASADIIGTVFAGAEVRVASRNSGWVKIVDPASGREGWIDSTVLTPLTPTAGTPSTEDFAAKQMPKNEPTGALNEPPLEQSFEIPEENDLSATTESQPPAKAKRHSSNPHYGRKRFVVRFNLRRFFRR